MQPIVRRTKKMAKKSVLNTAKTAAQAEKKIPAVPAGHSTGWRDKEELCGLPGAVGESVALDYRSGNVPVGQKARFGWLWLHAYSRWKLDV